MAIPAAKEEKKPLPEFPVLGEAPAPYEKREYRSYIAEVFNDGEALSRYSQEGCTLAAREVDSRNRYVRMGRGSWLSAALCGASSRIVATAKISCSEGILILAVMGETGAVCGAVLDGDMLRTMDGTDIAPYVAGHELSVRLVLDTERGEYDVWADSRRIMAGVEVLSDREPLSVAVSCDGEGTLDNLYVFDDTAVYAAREEFNTDFDVMSPSKNAVCSLADYPFGDDKSFSLSSADGMAAYAEYRFPPISGVLSVETKVRADDEKLILTPEITDDKGNPVCSRPTARTG